MSHTSALKAVEMRDESILLHVAEKLRIKYKGKDTVKLYDGTSHTGHVFDMNGWRYPLIINTETGTAAYDNFGGSWGAQDELDKLVQEYAAESNRRLATAQGYLMQEEYLEDGTLLQTFETVQS